MINLLLVSTEKDALSEVSRHLEQRDGITIHLAGSGKKALEMISETDFDLVLSDQTLGDMTGLEFVKKLVSTNPMINCAAVSSLSHKEFHEASEGLGLLMQLPVRPGKQDAETLINRLEEILNLTRITA